MKTVIITGASGNLGAAVVGKFLTEGWQVIGTISKQGARSGSPRKNYQEYVVDLTNEDQSVKFIESVIADYKNIDAAVLTVGGFAMGKIVETRTSDVLKQYRLNFETAYNIAQPLFVQMMKQGNGRIFFISSRPGLDPHNAKGKVAYGLSKSLLVTLAELMNDEAKGHNIIASIVAPSTIDTPENRKAMPDAKFENWVRPEDIATVIWDYCEGATSIIREPVIKVYGNA